MNKDIILEAEFFLSSFFWGIGLLFLYDCIRIFRKVRHHIWAAIAAEDCLFWGIAGIFIFHMVYERNYGIIRAFAAGGMALGMWLYLGLVSRWYITAAVRTIHKAESGATRFVKFITKPFQFLYTKIDKQLNKISQFLKKKINVYLEKRKKRLKSSYEQYKMKVDAKKALKRQEKDARKQERQQDRKRRKKELENEAPVERPKRAVLERIEPAAGEGRSEA